MRMSALGIGVGMMVAFGLMIWPEPWLAVNWSGFVVGLGLVAWSGIGLAREKRSRGAVARWWARLRRRPVERDVWLSDALNFVAFGTWDLSKEPELTGATITAMHQAGEQARQYALDDALPIWGRDGFSGPWKRLPAEYWEAYEIDQFGLMKGEREDLQTEATQNFQSISEPVYRALMTSRAAVERLSWH